MSTPLAGIRVVDFGQGAAGPYCGQLLGDHGADVVKVEPPRGDWGRSLGSIDPGTGMSSTHLSMNRNKRSICLDLTNADARGVAQALCRRADVVVESFRPGVMSKLGLGLDKLRSMNPRLVYCSITGFGSDGPAAHVPASDSMMQSYGGLMSIIGHDGGPPLRVGNVVSDMLAGSNAFAAVLLALLDRGRTGAGRRVEVSLLDSLVAFQTTSLTEYLLTGELPQPRGNRHPLIGASGVARAADGWVAIGVLDHYWSAFCTAIALPELITDSRFATAQARLSAQRELWDELEPVLARRSVGDWVVTLNQVGVVCGPVHDYADLSADAQVRHNELFAMSDAERTSVPMVRNPLRVEGFRPDYLPPPRLGEHTVAVLHELGHDPAAVRRLLASGAALGPPGTYAG